MQDKYDAFLDQEDVKYDVFLDDEPKQKQAPSRDAVEQLLRGTALVGKASAKGITSIPSLLAEGVAYPINKASSFINSVFGTNIPKSEPSGLLSGLIDKAYPGIEAESAAERIASDAVSAVGAGAGFSKVGSMLQGSSKPLASKVGSVLSANPVGQSVGAASGGAASGLAREAGAPIELQILAGFAGAAAPTIVAGVANSVRNGLRPVVNAVAVMSKQGKTNEAERILRELSKDDKQEILNAIKSRRTYIEGSKTTTSEAIAQGNIATKVSPEEASRFGGNIVNIQSQLAKSPGTSNSLRTDEVRRVAAHESALNKIAGTDAKLKAAKTFRESQTKPLWEKVKLSKVKVNASPVEKQIDDYLLNNPNEENITRPLLELKNKLSNSETPQEMASLSREIKRLMSAKTPGGSNEYDVSVLAKIKETLDDVIGKAEPLYKNVMAKYKELSAPINRMEVGRALKDKLLTQTGTESPGQYLRAADDAAKTIKSATGFSRYNKLGDVLNPKEVRLAERVAKDLERQIEVKRIAGELNIPGGAKLAESAELRIPNLLSRPVAVTNFILRNIGHDINPEVNKLMAKTLQDPEKFAEVLKTVPKDRLVEFLTKVEAIKRGGVAAGTSVLANPETIEE